MILLSFDLDGFLDSFSDNAATIEFLEVHSNQRGNDSWRRYVLHIILEARHDAQRMHDRVSVFKIVSGMLMEREIVSALWWASSCHGTI